MDTQSPDRAIRVLLVDPDPAEHALIGMLLSGIGHTAYELTWCRDSAHAAEAIAAELHDVVLLDFQADRGSALALLCHSVQQGCSRPIIVMTDEMDRHVDREAIRSGASDYLLKGRIDSQLLERAIRYAIERKHAEQRLARLAHYDALTNVPNRILFRDRLAGAIERARRSHQTVALFFIDLDGFKQINDTQGHDAGDALIRAVAERLSACVRKSDSVARIGGDEFTLILEDISTTGDIVHVARKLIEVISRPVPFGTQQLFVGASIGIAVYPEGGDDVDTLLKHADMAMYQAKGLRGSAYRFYTEKMNVEATNQMYLEADLRRALRREEFELYYQPRIALGDGRIAGVESLLRWNHPVRGVVSPGEFIPLAEEVGLIVPIGYWAIHQACQDIRRMDAEGMEPIHVAVNLSFRQFLDEKFVQTVSNIITDSGVDPTRLEFELTETTIMSNVEDTERCMQVIRELGPTFSLDDFGTGYSSFAHIQRLPIGALKIDRSFVRNVDSVADDATIVRAIINLAHGLGLKVVAEGAETREQVGFLREHGCDQVQGFYFSTPVRFGEFSRLLRAENRAAG
ncbi:MAG: putative bifunctional diguanylate cyclase/phosphodiesterase [Gammaproteobacteria bacterium]